MDYLRQLFKDVLLYSEAIFLPELATYETEVFAATVIIGFVVLLGECQLSRKIAILPQVSTALLGEHSLQIQCWLPWSIGD